MQKRVFFSTYLLIPANCFIEMKITVRFYWGIKKILFSVELSWVFYVYVLYVYKNWIQSIVSSWFIYLPMWGLIKDIMLDRVNRYDIFWFKKKTKIFYIFLFIKIYDYFSDILLVEMAELKENKAIVVVPHKPIKVLLNTVSQQITCFLCKGYLIDATTIVECLHSCKFVYFW